MQQATEAVRATQTTITPRTFLDDLNAIMASGAFTDPDQQATDDEPVIGEMTDYERALHTLSRSCEVEQRELIARNFNGLGEYVGEERHDRTIRQIKSLKERGEIVMGLLWTSIRDRLHDTIHGAADHTSIGIRQGFKVVLMFDEEDCLGSLLGPILRIRI